MRIPTSDDSFLTLVPRRYGAEQRSRPVTPSFATVMRITRVLRMQLRITV